jgi:hypothetical protein
MMEAEEADLEYQVGCHFHFVHPYRRCVVKHDETITKAVVPPQKPDPFRAGYVKYEIHLHPTYQAPCLWFSLHDLPAGEQEQALHIDTVFRRLVPEQFKAGLRASVGGIGGISVDVRLSPSPSPLLFSLEILGNCHYLYCLWEMMLKGGG